MMSGEETSKREHIHTQKYTYRFQSNVLAPILQSKGGSGKPRVSVEDMVYLSGVGLEIVDPFAQNNEYIIAFINYVRIKEQQGYEHTGKSADSMTEFYKNLWNINELGEK